MASAMKHSAPRAAMRAAAPRGGLKVLAVARPQATPKAQAADAKLMASLLAGSALLLQASPAHASEAVDSTVDSVVTAIKAAGEAVDTGLSVVQSGIQILKEGYDVVAPVAKQAVDAVAPVVVEAVKTTADLAMPVVESAAPAVSSTVNDVLKSSGVDFNSVSKTVSSAASTAAPKVVPVANKVVDFITSSDPTTLGEYALGGVAFYYLAPVLLGALKGYQGGVTAASALDAIVNDSNVVLIDIRQAREKEAGGAIDVPGSASSRVFEVEYAAMEDKKLRSQMRDASYVEAQTTALLISSLKRINKGTKILVLDRYGPSAEAVARELAKKGYGKCYIVAGGFDGRSGWVASKLQIKPYTPGSSTFAAPSFGTRSTTPSTRTLRSLPAPKA